MYILHRQTKIKDILGYTCLALLNPVGSGKNLKITKVEISSHNQVDIALISGAIEIIYPSQDISGDIRSNVLGDKTVSVGKAYYEPNFLNPTVLIKSASIAPATQRKLIDNSDFLTLGEGQAIGLRALPFAQFQEIHLTIIFDEI